MHKIRQFRLFFSWRISEKKYGEWIPCAGYIMTRKENRFGSKCIQKFIAVYCRRYTVEINKSKQNGNYNDEKERQEGEFIFE